MSALPIRRPRADVQRDLAVLVSGRPPFLSVYLDLSPGEARATAPRRLSAALTDRLDTLGGTGTELARNSDRIQATLATAPDDDALFVAVANSDGQLLTASYPDPPRNDVVEVGDVPRLGALLAAEQTLTHHVVAIINGEELTMLAVPRHGEPEQSSYAGQDPLAIAPIVQHASRASETNLLVVCAPASDLATVANQIRTGLPIDVNLATVPLDDLDLTQLATEIVVRTADHAATRTVELLRLYRFHQSHDEVADGAAATCDALMGGRAALVLVNDDVGDDRIGWLALAGEGAPACARVDEPPSVEGWRRGRLADVVIGAALVSGCGVHLVPRVEDTLADGIGSILAERAAPSDLAELLEY